MGNFWNGEDSVMSNAPEGTGILMLLRRKLQKSGTMRYEEVKTGDISHSFQWSGRGQ